MSKQRLSAVGYMANLRKPFENLPWRTTDWLLAQIDADSLRVDLDAGVSDSRENTPPVRIGAGPRGFHQRRVGDGAANASCIASRAGLLNLKSYHVLHAFPIGHNLRSQ